MEALKHRTLHILLLRHGQTDANAAGILQGHLPTPLNLVGLRQATRLAERLASYRPPVQALICSDLPRAMQTAAPIAAACRLTPRTDPAWRERDFGPWAGRSVSARQLWIAAAGEGAAVAASPGAAPVGLPSPALEPARLAPALASAAAAPAAVESVVADPVAAGIIIPSSADTVAGDIDPPGGEPAAALRRRVLTALLQLPVRYRRLHCIAVVTHGGPIRCILRMLLQNEIAATRGSMLPRLRAASQLPTIANCSVLHLMARHYRDGVRWRVSSLNDVAHLERQ